MPVNANKPERWKADIAQSVDFYNMWFLRFAPKAYLSTRAETTEQVKEALQWTASLTHIEPDVFRQHPSVLPILRMATAPPIARDRLIGLAKVSPHLVKSLELKGQLPSRMDAAEASAELLKISQVIKKLIDEDLFPWLKTNASPTDQERYRAATVVSDRLCGTVADPIIRNAQEQRQLFAIKQWLEARSYTPNEPGSQVKFDEMPPGTFAFRLNIPVQQAGRAKPVKIPIDAVIRPLQSSLSNFPLLVEAKSAGDFTNPNKRRKEEATKVAQLRRTYGPDVCFVLFLCGYFDSGYLGYEAAEGIDWVWEHRMDDFAFFGL